MKRTLKQNLRLVLFACFSATSLISCASSSGLTCRRLQLSGQVVSSQNACVQCVEQFGSTNVDAIRGCALGVDAAELINATK